jgi:murein DD-endopeptidase MepM/ murein hydrolase activator NlpD
VAGVRAEVARLERRLDRMRRDRTAAVARLASAKATLTDRAAWAYMRGPLHEMTSLLEADSPNDAYHRQTMVQNVLEADHDALVEYRRAREALSADVRRVTEDLEAARDELVAAEHGLWRATERVAETAYELAIVTAGSSIVIHGFVFPVAGPTLFVDTFLADRMPGTEHAHLHQGTDIFAPAGTPLVASERGVIAKMGTDVLGGIKLWLVGESGARYYYAHLSAFADDIAEGDVVEAGTIVGFVGNTGNAAGTPSHLHFEIHPGAGPAINPYPLLKAVDEVG